MIYTELFTTLKHTTKSAILEHIRKDTSHKNVFIGTNAAASLSYPQTCVWCEFPL